MALLLVEHRRFELLTPTLPVLCATNCANAPNSRNYSITFRVCKAFFLPWADVADVVSVVQWTGTGKNKGNNIARSEMI